MRHGKVDCPPLSMLSAASFSKWIDAYNSNALDVNSIPGEDVKFIAAQAGVVICSALKRSVESARKLGIENIHLSDSLFDEASMYVPNWNILKLPVPLWALYFRLAWFFGYSGNTETAKEAKQRAIKATNRLIDLAQGNDSVLFVGHGILNALIAKELKGRGWLMSPKLNRRYWGFGKFTLK